MSIAPNSAPRRSAGPSTGWLSPMWQRVAMVAILAVAIWLRLHEATRTRLWFDEIYTLWVARLHFSELLATHSV